MYSQEHKVGIKNIATEGELAARSQLLQATIENLPELLGLCDRIAVMQRGRLGDAVPAEAFSEHELMVAVTSGAAGA